MKNRKLKYSSLVLFLFVSVTVNNVSPVTAAGQEQISAHIDWRGVNLTTNTGLSQSFTPLNVPPHSIGQADWSINMGNTEQALWPSFNLSNSGRAIFSFFTNISGLNKPFFMP